MISTAVLLRTLLAAAFLIGVTVVVLTLFRVQRRWSPGWAVVRGALQLAAISLVLSGLITHPALIAVALAIMFTVASSTSTRRLGWSWKHFWTVAGAMLGGIATTMLVVFGTGAIEFSARYLLAVGGIIIGNSMSVATLTGRTLNTTIIDHWDEVEGWLALGATPRRATADLARRAVESALVPLTDQTRTTGLVTLPGAFVGAIFGGVSPVEAGRFQIMVLAGALAAGSVTGVLVARAFAPVTRKPMPL